jgi:hypothetical protein
MFIFLTNLKKLQTELCSLMYFLSLVLFFWWMHDGLYQRLGMIEMEKDIYRLAKSRERKMRDVIQVKCIKD